MATRSPEIPAREWWLIRARELLKADPRKLQELGRDLAVHIRRQEPFSHSVLSRFKNGEIGVTLDLAEALTIAFVDLPSPVLFPESNEEALALMHTASRYRSGRPVPPHNDGPPAPVLTLPKPKKPTAGPGRALRARQESKAGGQK